MCDTLDPAHAYVYNYQRTGAHKGVTYVQMIKYVSNEHRVVLPFFWINLHFFLRPCFEIWSMSTACPPATRGEHTHPSKQHSRCSPVRPAAHKDEKTADPSLTTSPGWATFQPPELNLASVEAELGYFIFTSSIHFCLLYLVGWNLTKFTTTKKEFIPPHPPLSGI